MVERIDPDHGTRDRRREFPLEELTTEFIDIRDAQTDDRLARSLECLHGRVLFGVRIGVQTNVYEYTVAAVRFGRPERLAIDRDDPFAELPR